MLGREMTLPRHDGPDQQQQQSEQHQQHFLPDHVMAERAAPRSDHACPTECRCGFWFDHPLPAIFPRADEGRRSHDHQRHGRRLLERHAGDIHHQRHAENRPARSGRAQLQADRHSGQHRA